MVQAFELFSVSVMRVSAGELIIGIRTLELASQEIVGSMVVPVVDVIVEVLNHYCGLLRRCKSWSCLRG